MIKAENQKKRKPFTAQDTIPYKEIYKDGICRTDDNYYSKMVQFYDINYQLAQNDDKAAIFENYCEFLNSFDSSVEVQITFLNQQVNFDEYAKNIDIPEQDDCFNDIRKEYSDNHRSKGFFDNVDHGKLLKQMANGQTKAGNISR